MDTTRGAGQARLAMGMAALAIGVAITTGTGSAGAAVPGPLPSRLAAVTAWTPMNAWAVGSRGASATTPLVEHWDGAHWTRVVIAKAGGPAELRGISQPAVKDLWVVGSVTSGAVQNTLAEHWDGTTWARVTTVNPADSVNRLDAVSADATSDVWAVGSSTTSAGLMRTLVERNQGSGWHQVTSLDPGDSKTLRTLLSVSALSATNVWAVGNYTPSGESQLPLIEHWNGTKWLESPPPNPEGSVATTLSGVDASSATDVWAVGSYQLNAANEQTLIEHWNGTAWSIVASPNGAGGVTSRFTGVSVVPGTDAWASGLTMENGKATPLLAHWDGTSWKRVKAPSVPGAFGTSPVAVSISRATDGWTVGSYAVDTVGNQAPLFEHWDGTKWALP